MEEASSADAAVGAARLQNQHAVLAVLGEARRDDRAGRPAAHDGIVRRAPVAHRRRGRLREELARALRQGRAGRDRDEAGRDVRGAQAREPFAARRWSCRRCWQLGGRQGAVRANFRVHLVPP